MCGIQQTSTRFSARDPTGIKQKFSVKYKRDREKFLYAIRQKYQSFAQNPTHIKQFLWKIQQITNRISARNPTDGEEKFCSESNRYETEYLCGIQQM